MFGLAVLAGVTVTAAGELLGFAVCVILGIAALGGVLLLRLPARWWPTLMLVVTVLAPAYDLPIPGMQGQNGSLSPALLLFPFWLIAEQLEGRLHRLWTTPRKLAGLAGLLVSVALTVSLTLGGLSLGSVAWMVNFLLFTIALSLVLRRDAARLALSAITVLGAVLGVYAGIEAWILQANPLWAWTGAGGIRASASFGHVLDAGMFFALALVVAVHGLIQRPAPVPVLLVSGSAIGLAACGARGALTAAAVGIALLLAGGALGFGRARVRLLPMLLVVALVALAVMASLAERGAVGDSAGSNSVRYRALETGLYLAGRTDAFGSGPGLAYQVKTSTPGPGTDEKRSIENAWLELYVAVGPVGTAAVALFILACLLAGLHARAWLGVAGASTLLGDFGTFNALEGGKPLSMLLLGLMLGICLLPPADRRPDRRLRSSFGPVIAAPVAHSVTRTTAVT